MKWQPTSVLLLGKFLGWRSLVGYSPGVTKSWTRLSDFTFLIRLEIIYSFVPSSDSVNPWFLKLNSLLLKLATVVTVICNWTLINKTLKKLGFWPLIYSFTFLESTFWLQFHSFINWIAPKICIMHLPARSLQLCPTLCDSVDHSPPGSSVHGILQARIVEWVVMPFSRVSFWSRNQTSISYISCFGRRVLYHEWHPGSPYYASTRYLSLWWTWKTQNEN